ncbi:Phosphonate-transporting ATPase [Syntrophobotulus glycolicus DSM 8271]|uniref:Phosphonate-transporting ATPase n=1 Tax=Syntrophobotulus glycolicus (strain DSM 8271 / FlGlyR) TaxID=645991 RepID=F0T0Z6_SYNGF|nr:ABC transporter ATP-binding protein [Syntrophobotulus glycolicus]ADY57367.1 Phosphonate-transporting ATPase [Syntrophobotulus glycolicus DSM 8271]
MILHVRGLEFRYPSHFVFQDIDFSVDQGDCLAVLGTNGVGKSTLLKCLNRVLKPRGGAVCIHQDEISHLSRVELAKRVGYVAQKQEGTRCTVFDTVLMGRKPYIKWDVSPGDLEITRRVLNTLELGDYALRYLDELSGGEVQKVWIARALAQEPDLLMLDEPTSNLDLKNQLEVINIIKTVVKKQQIAAIVTMHDLNLALRFANKFLLLKEGKIFAIGGLEVMTPENIENVYSVPVVIRKYQDRPVVVPL